MNEDGDDVEDGRERVGDRVADAGEQQEAAVLPHDNRDYKILGEAGLPNGAGVVGHNTSGSGTAHGVDGVTDSDAGAGVRARAANGARALHATADLGQAVRAISKKSEGVFARSSEGTGGAFFANDGGADAIVGTNQATANLGGQGYGVRGVGYPQGDGSAGVYGYSTASTGRTYGVRARTVSAEAGAAGVYARTRQGSGATYGVHAVADTDDNGGAAVRAESPSGAPGVYATADGPAVRGEATTGTGVVGHSDERSGGSFVSSSASAAALRALNQAVSDQGSTGLGVRGVTRTEGDGSAGVYGYADSSTGQTYGVRGITGTSRAGGAGVYGEATSATGQTRGVVGETNSPHSGATGVRGAATLESGTTYGVHGTTASAGSDSAGVLASTSGSGSALVARGGVSVESPAAGGSPPTLSMTGGTTQKTAGPIAKGFVNQDATLAGAVNIGSVTWDSTTSSYVISVSGESYSTTGYATTVTPAQDVVAAATSSDSGNLLVAFADGNRHDFQFVIHDLPSGTTTT
jgi:hypothetical protein